MTDAYLTGAGSFLPGEPLDNDEIVRRLGAPASGAAAAVRDRVLAMNGIRTRHYALDARGTPYLLNEQLAAEAVQRAIKERGLDVEQIGMLAAATTQGDLLVPGFGSMVHGRLGGGPLEVLSAGGVCASSVAALAGAVRGVRLGEHPAAVAVGSELPSRSLRQPRYGDRPSFDVEFLRWTLSDGAGAVVVEPEPRPDGLSLRVDWTHLVSYAHQHPACMVAGASAGGRLDAGQTWLDQPTLADAASAGQVRLHQDVRALPGLFQVGLHEFMSLVRSGRLSPAAVDHVLCHYSAEHFRSDIFRLLREADLMIDEQRWFSNLATRGNTGAASIFVALAECWQTGRFKPGDRVLLIVPESGRFSFGFVHLTCVAGADPGQPARSAAPAAPMVEPVGSPLGEPLPDDSSVVRWTVLELAQVWSDFERRLAEVPLVRRIEAGTATVADYRRLLRQLRQQVVEGGRWLARAGSNFSVELFELRSAAIQHAVEEHRDFRMLEEDYVSVGGELADIQSAEKNVGSEALSAFMFQQASQPDPVDLLGAMFVIEGLGAAKATRWAQRLRHQLGLAEQQVRFLSYHGDNDDDHFEHLREVLRSGVVDQPAARRIVRTARVVARLYAWQLAEVDDE
ncbi:iron-containing redox enzyme family protein [Natronosporangium hydrolyticum]|uniref:Iron-containing redox enzyme family protein n=1 Tax=Natronosporangium hydrolyticum TaxID=2811111 RepID=A0A895YL42_9ACTN|nr:3-oxoacyl-[acyl-carrier-protein] synthase III C-terminal domain-containing protein [Natronosporangium hydrolyticum]QSB15386.1 iron-containing redox enzyme family protein [Natronosporangium hydrolyticum]